MGVTGIGHNCLPWPIVPFTLPFFEVQERDSVDGEVKLKGGAVISEFTY